MRRPPVGTLRRLLNQELGDDSDLEFWAIPAGGVTVIAVLVLGHFFRGDPPVGWFVATAFITFVVSWVGFLMGNSRRKPPWTRPRRTRACRHCGYCLNGNVSGGCPECGTRTGGWEEGDDSEASS